MLCYKTHKLSYITHDMLCHITHNKLCYITHDMLCNDTCYVRVRVI